MAKNSWWWAERVPETWRVIIPVKLEFGASVGFIHKESVTMQGHTIVKCSCMSSFRNTSYCFIDINRNKTYSSGFSGCQNITTPIMHFNDMFWIGITLLLSLTQLPTVKTSVGINFVRRDELIWTLKTPHRLWFEHCNLQFLISYLFRFLVEIRIVVVYFQCLCLHPPFVIQFLLHSIHINTVICFHQPLRRFVYPTYTITELGGAAKRSSLSRKINGHNTLHISTRKHVLILFPTFTTICLYIIVHKLDLLFCTLRQFTSNKKGAIRIYDWYGLSLYYSVYTYIHT